MNLRNRYLLVTLRTIFGLFMLFSGVSGFMAAANGMEGVPIEMRPMTQMLWDMGIFQMIKVTEVVAGLMLVTGVLPQLAVLFLAPVGVGIVVFNLSVAPPFAVMGLIVCAFLAYLTYAYWGCYRQLFVLRPRVADDAHGTDENALSRTDAAVA